MTLYQLKDLRDIFRVRPNARFRTARPGGPEKEVGRREIEKYFTNLSPKAAEYLGRWFEEIRDESDCED